MDALQTLTMPDYFAIAVYMALVAGIGMVVGAWVKDVSAYFKGGGTLPWFAAAISIFMSMFSTFIFVAYAGKAYQYGLVAVTLIWCTVTASLFAAIVIARLWRRAGVSSPVEYLETRFNAPARQVFSFAGIIFRILDNMVRLYAIGVFVSTATPLSLPAAVILSGVVAAAYTIVGGLWAVVLTDLLQFVVLMVAVMVLVPLSIAAAGGLENMVATVPDHFTLFQGPEGQFWFLFAYYVMILIKYNANWSFIQRFYSVRDEKAASKAALLAAFLFLVSPIFFLLPAIAARVVFPELENPEMSYVAMALHVLPPGIMGLMMAAMFAATMSATDSEFNVTAGVFTRDVYQRLLRPDASQRELMVVGRVATLILAVLVVMGALYVHEVMEGAFYANMVITGLAIPLSVPLVMGILTRWSRPAGAMLSIITGLATGITLTMIHPHVDWAITENRQLWWAVTTMAVIVVSIGTMLLSALFPVGSEAYRRRVDGFFKQLRTPIREEDKPDPDPRLRIPVRHIYTIALASTGAMFVGFGLWSVGEPGGRMSVLAGVICCGLALFIFVRTLQIVAAARRDPLTATSMERNRL